MLPNRETLQRLLNFAEQDNIKALREKIEQLVSQNAHYTPFADSILQLTKQFQTEEIEHRLHHYLTGGEGDGI